MTAVLSVSGSRLFGMTLSSDERELLKRISQASEPVAMSSFFVDLNHVDLDPQVPDDAPERAAWQERQFDLYGASIRLWQNELVRVVHPANGERPDLVTVTDAGRAALS